MKEIKVQGIVLREDPMGDKDKRIVLLSAELGKITILAKGAMSPKSKYRSLTSQFTFAEFVLTRGSTFYYIKEGTLIESFYELRSNIDRLAYGSFMLEVAEAFSLEGQENRDLLRILFRGLKNEASCEAGEESLPADITVFRILAENGFYPELTRCRNELSSQEEETEHRLDEEPILFIPESGSVCCSACVRARKAGSGILLRQGTLAALRYAIEQPAARAYSFKASEEVRRQFHEAVTDYLTLQTERSYQSLGFLSKIAPSP